MNDKYKIPDILEAIDTLLSNNKEKPLMLKNQEQKPLELTDQVQSKKKVENNVPKHTENIIAQAEKYLKK